VIWLQSYEFDVFGHKETEGHMVGTGEGADFNGVGAPEALFSRKTISFSGGSQNGLVLESPGIMATCSKLMLDDQKADRLDLGT
jgi:hypothetical protein